MQFSVNGTLNASSEQHRADHYPHLRLFTVGQGNRTAVAPWRDLQSIEQPWHVIALPAPLHCAVRDRLSFACACAPLLQSHESCSGVQAYTVQEDARKMP